MSARPSGRRADELRPLAHHPPLHEARRGLRADRGRATPRCCAPPASRTACRALLKGKGQGWLTAEYGMLPRATNTRDAARSRRGPAIGAHAGDPAADRAQPARGHRSRALGERTIKIDCDVLQADGGTRCASITGACVALADAIAWCRTRGLIAARAADRFVAAVSVGHRRRRADARSRLRRGLRLRHRHERRDDRRAAASSSCRAPPRARRSRAPRWTRSSTLAARGIRELIAAQKAALAAVT